MNANKVVKITAILNKGTSSEIINLLNEKNIKNVTLGAGRTLTLEEKRKMFGLINEISDYDLICLI